MNIQLKNILFVFIALTTILSVNPWSFFPIGNTFFWWGIQFLFFILIISGKKFYFNPINKKPLWPIFIFLIWMGICILRAFLVAQNYWEWKNLVTTSFVLLLGLVVFVFTNPAFIQFQLNKWFHFVLPLFVVLFVLFSSDAYGHYLAPVLLLLVLFPSLPTKWKGIVLFFTLTILIFGITARSNVIKFSIAFLLSYSLYTFRSFLKINFFNVIRLIFLIAPITFFTLGILGIFNIFQISEYIEGDYTAKVKTSEELREESLTIDTRTFLYAEVLSSAIDNDYIYFGRTPARGNDSKAFGYILGKELGTGKNERFSNEVAILNIFTWTGLLGVVLYFIIFMKASYLAINRSNNYFMKIIGLYVSFRWMYSWVEDFSRFDLTNIILWIMISMCFSVDFRKMTNNQMKAWVYGLFYKRYSLNQTYISKK